MTLVVALASSSVAVLVADRRLSRRSEVLSDEYNKVTVLFCDDARLAVAFTGLATQSAFDTSTWIAETLFAIGETKRLVHEVLEEFRHRLGKAFANLTGDDRRLSVVFCGFVYWTTEPESRVFVLSNYEHSSYEPSTFTMRTRGGDGCNIVELAGNTSPVGVKTVERLNALLQTEVSASSLVRFAVTHLQNAASHSRSSGNIGEQCNAVVVYATPDTAVVNTYHTAKNVNCAYGANVVILGNQVSLGTEVMGPGILAGTEIRKKDPCWCGSSRTFGYCHLKKYGAVYVRHPAWARPLFAVTRVVRDDQVPSGRIFCVQSGYA